MKKFIFKSFIFLVIIAPICLRLNSILAQKWSYEEDYAATQIATSVVTELIKQAILPSI